MGVVAKKETIVVDLKEDIVLAAHRHRAGIQTRVLQAPSPYVLYALKTIIGRIVLDRDGILPERSGRK